MVICDHFDSLLERYDGFLINTHGTLHEGTRVFPEALTFLHKIKMLSKKVVLLSNAPWRSSYIKEWLAKKGLGPSLYEGIVSSGDDVHEQLASINGRYKDFGKTFFHIGTPRHMLWGGTSFRPVSFLREASFILATGLMPGRYDTKSYSDLFTEALMLDLPLVCVNTDHFVCFKETKILCAGKLGELYAQLEGEVYWHGKPKRLFFQKALKFLEGIDRRRILVIGDGMATDIRGAFKLSLDSAFIVGGSAEGELRVLLGKTLNVEKLEAFLEKYTVRPTYVLPALRITQ